MTRTVLFHELGGPEVMRLEDVEVGDPGPGEVRIRVDAIGLNRAEALFRSGHYIEPAKRFPARLGTEAAGVIEAVGSGVTGLRPGEPVSTVPAFSQNDYGVYADQAIVPAAAVLRRPEGLGAVDGAAVWMPYVTAYGALVEVGGLRAGDTVVLNAASSSVGLAAIQVADRVGARSDRAHPYGGQEGGAAETGRGGGDRHRVGGRGRVGAGGDGRPGDRVRLRRRGRPGPDGPGQGGRRRRHDPGVRGAERRADAVPGDRPRDAAAEHPHLHAA